MSNEKVDYAPAALPAPSLPTAPAFAEALPDSCPPATALEPQQMVVYRLLEAAPACEDDFKSYATLQPKKFGSKCIHFAVSVFTQRESLARLLEMPVHAHKVTGKLTLTPDSGRVQKTGSENHYSWWLYHGFDAPSACEVES